jgi:hypothetical protein
MRPSRQTGAARKLEDALSVAVSAGQTMQGKSEVYSHADLHLYRFHDNRPCRRRRADGPHVGRTPGRQPQPRVRIEDGAPLLWNWFRTEVFSDRESPECYL